MRVLPLVLLVSSAHAGAMAVVACSGMDTLPYDALNGSSCGATYRYGATGIRLTLKRR